MIFIFFTRYAKALLKHMIKKFQRILLLMKVLPTIVFIFGMLVLLGSCKVYKPAYYFKEMTKDTTITGFVNDNMELKIRQNDLLTISISSLNPLEDGLFNKAPSGVEGKVGFQVTPDGNIYLHKLGKIAVAGLTRKELKAKLETDLLPYLKDPIVTINFANHRITVLLEQSSKVVDMPDERMSLLEVMAQSGGVTINSQLNNLMVIRETANAKQVKHLNLQDPSIFTSPWYYLQPNDIVVVKPNEEKIMSEQKQTRNLLLFTTLLSVTSFVFLVIDRISR